MGRLTFGISDTQTRAPFVRFRQQPLAGCQKNKMLDLYFFDLFHALLGDLEKTPMPENAPTRTTILLVEERDLGNLLRNLLRSSGYRVLTCTTGKMAVQVCKRLNTKI